MDYVNFRAVLGEKRGLLHGRVSASDHRQRLVPENRSSSVAHGAGRNPSVPEASLAVSRAGEDEALGDGAGGNDDCIGLNGFGIGEDFEGRGGEIDLGDGLGEDLSAEPDGLAPAAVHELYAEDSVWKPREVLDVGGGGELAAGSNIIGHPSLEENRLQLRSGGVYGSRVRRRATADNTDFGF